MPFRLRAIPSGFHPPTLGAIDRSLTQIGEEANVAIGLAIESGSRAWGFPSPDSGYDCRFIFVRSSDDYLSPWQKRDVIEVPPEGELDINGWELGKALKLLVKGNAVVVEWLMSPILYDGDVGFRDDLAQFAACHLNRVGVARHYLHLGERQRRTYFADGKHINLKKIFYALRPAAALRWLRLHPDKPIAPMHFPTLMLSCDPPHEVQKITAELIERKAQTRELGGAVLPPAIETFIDGEFSIARETLPASPCRMNEEAKSAADALFRASIARFGSGDGSTNGRTTGSTGE